MNLESCKFRIPFETLLLLEVGKVASARERQPTAV